MERKGGGIGGEDGGKFTTPEATTLSWSATQWNGGLIVGTTNVPGDFFHLELNRNWRGEIKIERKKERAGQINKKKESSLACGEKVPERTNRASLSQETHSAN